MNQDPIKSARRRAATIITTGVAGAAAIAGGVVGANANVDSRPACDVPAVRGEGVDFLASSLNNAGGNVSGSIIVKSPDGETRTVEQLGNGMYDNFDGTMAMGEMAEFPHADPQACRYIGGKVVAHETAK